MGKLDTVSGHDGGGRGGGLDFILIMKGYIMRGVPAGTDMA